jgi:hypothetical protein
MRALIFRENFDGWRFGAFSPPYLTLSKIPPNSKLINILPSSDIVREYGETKRSEVM